MGGALETTLSDWADRARAAGGLVIAPHLPVPNGELAALVAMGRVDAVEMVDHKPAAHREYYRYLNSGYRLPLAGGTDKMTAEVPVGLYRTYVRIPEDQPFTFESWCANLAAGRTFLSGGPLLDFTIEGALPGDVLRLPPDGATVEVRATAASIFPIHRLEIVDRGTVVAVAEERAGSRLLTLRARLPVRGHGWFAARVAGPGYESIPHHDSWSRGIMAHTSPIYVACGDDRKLFDAEGIHYLVALIECALAYVRETSTRYSSEDVTHHHGESDHSAFLERPFVEARAALQRRLASSA
jgi:hypothetical protein